MQVRTEHSTTKAATAAGANAYRSSGATDCIDGVDEARTLSISLGIVRTFFCRARSMPRSTAASATNAYAATSSEVCGFCGISDSLEEIGNAHAVFQKHTICPTPRIPKYKVSKATARLY